MHTEVYANQRTSAQTEPVKSTKSPDNFLHLLPEHRNEITNQWLTHLVSQRISGNGMRLLNTIYRHTIGFDKIADDMSGLRLQQISHIRADHANHMIKILAADNAIISTNGRYGKVLSINFHFASWGKAKERTSNAPIQHIADPRYLLPKRYHEDPIDTGNVVGANYDEVLDNVNYDPSEPYLNHFPETATKTAVDSVLQAQNPLAEQTTLNQVLQHTTQLFETLLEKIERLEQRMDANDADKKTYSSEQAQAPKIVVKKTQKSTKNNDNQVTLSTCETATTQDKSITSKTETVPIKDQISCSNIDAAVTNTVLEINTNAPNISEHFLENTVVEWVQTESNQPTDYDNNQTKQAQHSIVKNQNSHSENTLSEHHSKAIQSNTPPDHSQCNNQTVSHNNYSEKQVVTEIKGTDNHPNSDKKANKNKDLNYPEVLGLENRTPLFNILKRVPKHAQDILDLMALRMNNTQNPINGMAQYCSSLVRIAQTGQLDLDALNANRAQRKVALDPKKKQWDALQQEYRDAHAEYEHFDRINKGQANYHNCTVEEYLEKSGMTTNWNNILKRLETVKQKIDALGYTP